jgi:ABC-2 type transport system permease protein
MTTTATYTAHGSGISFRGLLLSEWIKLTTLRSTVWCYAIIVAINLGLAVLAASGQAQGGQAAALDQGLLVRSATIGIVFSQLVISVLGALVITGEYGTGMIRSTLTAVPRRLPALFAKVVVFGLSTFAVSLVSIVGSALLAAPILAGKGFSLDLADGRVWGALIGGAGYLALVGLIALFLGTIVRNSAAGISAALGLLLVAPVVLQIFAAVTQAAWAQNVYQFLPSSAGGTLYRYAVDPVPAIKDVLVLDAGQGLLVLVAWVVLFGAIAAVLLKRRDA